MEGFKEHWRQLILSRKGKNSGLRELYCLPEAMNGKKWVMYGSLGAGVWYGLTYIFYHSLFPGTVTMLPFLWFYFPWIRNVLHQKQLRLTRRQFEEMVQILSASLRTGHSAETAMFEAYGQLSGMEGEAAYMVTVLKTMQQQMSLGVTAEAVWTEFAGKCELDEVKEFAKAFVLAKRGGASMPAILQKIADQIAMKLHTENQIETMIAGKRLEQNIMNLMPAAILLYVSVTSPELLTVMYRTGTGRVIMTICLGVYIGAYILSNRITRLPL